MRKILVISAILLLALFLRIYKVTSIPPSLNWDEVSIGYNAYSILKTGKDEWGKFFPLHFKSYGEYKLPTQIYFSIPALSIFGLNDFGVRITPVIYGTLTVLLLYFLVLELFSNYPSRFKFKLGLISAFLLAISPWHIQLTRASFESSFSVFWIVMGVWFFIKGLVKPKWWICSIIPFVISIYTYNSARIFTPLFLFVIFLIYKKDILKHKKEALISFLLFVGLLIPLVPFVLSGEAAARYKLVSITNEEGLIPRINERRGASMLPPPIPKLIHNKVTYISYYFVKNYLAHFTPDFLFISGAGHRQHSVQGLGELYLFQAPFLLYGIYLIFKRKEKYRWLIVGWLLLAFVPVATTKDSIPNALRTLIAAPVYQIFTAYGIVYLFDGVFKKSRFTYHLLLPALILLGIFEFGHYLYQFYYVYPIKYSRDWQYGNKQVVEYISKHYDNYDLIVYTREYGEPHMFTLFYLKLQENRANCTDELKVKKHFFLGMKPSLEDGKCYFNYPPDNYQNNPNLDRLETNDWVWVLKFDKLYFPNLSDSWSTYEMIVRENPGEKILFIGKSNDFPEDKKRLTIINFLNGENAFEIVDNQ